MNASELIEERASLLERLVVELCPFCRMRQAAEGETFCPLCTKIAQWLVQLGHNPKHRIRNIGGK